MRLNRTATALVFIMLAGSIPAVAAQAATPTPPPVVKPTGTIRGLVTDVSTGAPIAGACVDVFMLNLWEPRAQACTAADGGYEFPALPTGSATFLRASAAGYPAQWWPRSATRTAAFTLSVGALKQADFALGTATAALSGLVRQPDGTPAPQASVFLYRPGDPNHSGFFPSGTDGRFDAPQVPPGDYQIRFTWDNYQSRWYGGTTDRATAATVTLAAGSPVELTLDVAAENPTPTPRPRATVSGRVTDESNAPISGATVQIKSSPDTVYWQATTDANGNYTIPDALVNTSYYVEVGAPGQPHVWAPNSPLPRTTPITAGTPVNVVIAQHTGTLTGRLIDFDGGTPPGVARVLIYAGITQGNLFAVVYARPDGTFEVPRVPQNVYRIAMLTNGRPQQFHPAVRNWIDSTVFTVQDGQTVDVTFNLVGPAFLRATILDAESGAPVPGGCVASSCAGADGVAFYGPLWTVDPTLFIGVTAQAGHVYFAEYRTITLNRGEVTAAEFRLRPGAALSIPISNASPGTQVCIRLVQTGIAPGSEAACEFSSDGATVVFGPISPGLRQVFIQPGVGTGAQWLSDHGGSGRRDEAVVLDLRLREVTQAPPTHLDMPGSIAGDVLSATGGGLVWACAAISAELMSSCTSGGQYELSGLGPYSWPVHFTASGFAAQWPGNAPNGRAATSVVVTPGSVTRADATFQLQGYLAGLSEMGVEPGTIVDAYDAWTGDWLSTAAIGDGALLAGLNSGRVLLRYIGSGGACWIRQKLSGGLESPYFSTRQGQVVRVDAAKLTCRIQEPALLRDPGRRGVEPAQSTIPPRRTVPDVPSAAPTQMPFGRWVQQRLAALGL